MDQVSRVTGTGELLALLPYHIGFHPRRSLVVVAFQGKRLLTVQRADLPAAAADADRLGSVLLRAMREHEPSAVLVAGYEDAPGESRDAVAALEQLCAAAGLPVLDRLVVRDGRWWSLHCADPGCCIPDGERLPEPSRVPAVADYVLRGVRPLADRSDLARRLLPSRPLELAVVDALVDDELALRLAAAHACDEGRPDAMADRIREELAVWAEVFGPVASADGSAFDPSPRQLARLAVSLQDRDLRDCLIAWTCPGWHEPDHSRTALLVRNMLPRLATGGAGPRPEDSDSALAAYERLVVVCSRLPEAWSPGPLCVLSWVAWWLGDGAAAQVALERVATISPQYSLAVLMGRLMNQGWRPRQLAAEDRQLSRLLGGPARGRRPARRRRKGRAA